MNTNRLLMVGTAVAVAGAGLVLTTRAPGNQASGQALHVTPAAYRQHGVEIRDAIGEEAAPITAQEKARIRRAVRTPRNVSYTLLYQSFEGPVSEIGSDYDKFVRELKDQKVKVSETVPALAVVLENPEGGKSVRIQVGLAVKRRFRVREPLALRTLNIPNAVSYLHKGPYGKITAVHREILQATNLGPDAGLPTVLRLIADPKTASSPEELKTEIIVPTARR